jgi:hypothetical protein
VEVVGRTAVYFVSISSSLGFLVGYGVWPFCSGFFYSYTLSTLLVTTAVSGGLDNNF